MGVTTIEAIEILTEVQVMDDSMYAYDPKYNEALEMAINTLKAQEPVRPVKRSFTISGDDEYLSTPPITVCGACGAWLKTAAPVDKYCPQCGKAVKWDD